MVTRNSFPSFLNLALSTFFGVILSLILGDGLSFASADKKKIDKPPKGHVSILGKEKNKALKGRESNSQPNWIPELKPEDAAIREGKLTESLKKIPLKYYPRAEIPKNFDRNAFYRAMGK